MIRSISSFLFQHHITSHTKPSSRLTWIIQWSHPKKIPKDTDEDCLSDSQTNSVDILKAKQFSPDRTCWLHYSRPLQKRLQSTDCMYYYYYYYAV